MTENNESITENFNFDLPKNRSNVIKVIGIGGGGGNAINYMFQQGIVGVDFVIDLLQKVTDGDNDFDCI